MMPEQRKPKFVIPIIHPEWLADAIKGAQQTLQLSATGVIPDALHGWMIHTSLLRVLRVIHGSDRATIVAIEDGLKRSAEIEEQIDKHMAEFPHGCGSVDCPICDAGSTVRAAIARAEGRG